MQRPPVSRQRDVKGQIAFGYGAGDGVVNRLSDDKILEEVTFGSLRPQSAPSSLITEKLTTEN